MVELHFSTEVSYQELTLSVELNNPLLITKVVNNYRTIGSDALKTKKKGRQSKITNQ